MFDILVPGLIEFSITVPKLFPFFVYCFYLIEDWRLFMFPF